MKHNLLFRIWTGLRLNRRYKALATLAPVPVFLFILASFPIILPAQTIIWEEVFNESNGATSGTASGPAGTSWTVTGHTSGGQLQVSSGNGRLEGTNIMEQEIWSTGPIDISAYNSVSVYMSIGESGNQEGDDIILCQYSYNGSTWTTLTDGSQSDDFNSAAPFATGLSGTNLYLRVIVDNDGSGSGSETHWLDNVQIFACTANTLPYAYGFETQTAIQNGNCASNGTVTLVDCWLNASGDNQDWKPHSGGTASSGTGPSGASEGSNYMYTETSDGCGSHPYTFYLRSPEFDFSANCAVTLTFDRHMYGSHTGTMSLYASTNGGSSWSAALWTLPGDQGDAWVEQSVDLSAYAGETSVYLEWRYTGTSNSGSDSNYQGDAAIDNVNLTGITGPTLTVEPASLDFGYTASGGTSAEMTYELSGGCLSPPLGNLTVTAPSNFEVSLSSGSGFGTSVNVPYTGSALTATTIYVRFKPTAPDTDYSGNIANSGGGATTVNVAVSGTTISTCTGYAVSVESQSGVSNPDNALGAPDGTEAALDDDNDVLTLDLEETLTSGGSLVVRWRENGSGKPSVTIEISDNASTWTEVPGSPITVNPSSFDDQTITLNADTRYIRFTTNDGNNLRIDAVSYADQPCAPPCPNITATLTGTTTICPGENTNLTVAISGGTGPYEVVYTDGQGNTTTVTGYTSGANISVSPASTRTYTLVSVTDDNGCTATLSGSAVITVDPTPAAPTGDAEQNFCDADNPMVADLVASGSNIQWYAGASGGSPLAASTALVDGMHYYASQTVTGCESATRLDVTAAVNAAPVTTGVSICPGGSGELTSSTSCTGGGTSASGPNNAGSGANDAGIGNTAWTDTGDIDSDDNTYASVTLPDENAVSNYLTGANYSFAIPSGATINGIEVTIGRYSSNVSGFVRLRDNEVRMLKGGVVVGTDHANTGVDWPTSEAAITYGGASDLWGTTWTPSDINDAGFGVALSVLNATGASFSYTGFVDYVQLTVTYTVPGSLDWYTVSSGGTSIGSGSPFNPVGVSGSGLPNTNTPGTYTFWAECASTPGCRAATDFIIHENPAALISASESSGAPDDDILCPSGMASLTAAGSGGASPYGYDWSSGLGTGPGPKNVSPANGVHTYTVTVTDDNSCTGTDTHVLTVQDNTPPTAFNPAPITGIQCIAGVPAPDPSVVTDEADSCPGAVTVAHLNDANNGGAGCTASPYIVTRTYRVTDANSNTLDVTQTITVIDDTPPSISCSGTPQTLNLDANCQAALADYTGLASASDNCSGVTLSQSPAAGVEFTNVQSLSVALTATDACGNSSSCAVTVNLVDNTPPALSCPANATLTPDPGACERAISSLAYEAGSNTDNCGSAGLAYSTVGGSVSPASGSSLLGAVLGAGANTISWTATDAAGLTGTCQFTLTISGCKTISGTLLHKGDGVSGVGLATAALSGDAADTDGPTAASGTYSLTANTGSDFTITPAKNVVESSPYPSLFNGVDAGDAAAIQQHLTGLSVLTDAYRLVAADCNKDLVISTADAAAIRQGLLEDPAGLALWNAKGSWRFIPTDYTFSGAGPYNLPAYPEIRTLTGLSGNSTGNDFFGVKVGDVLDAADPTTRPDPDAKPLIWRVRDRALKDGQQIRLDFSVQNFTDIAAYQFALRFDPAVLRFESVEVATTAIPLDPGGNFGLFNVAGGEIRTLWSIPQGISLPGVQKVFSLHFTVLKSGYMLSAVMALYPEVLPPVAYNTVLAPRELQLVFANYFTLGRSDADEPEPGLELYQNRPNPFSGSTLISFNLPEACMAQLRVLDLTGRELLRIDKDYPAGYNEEILSPGDDLPPGLLLCELTTPFGKLVRRMMVE